MGGERSGSRDVDRRSRGRSCFVALRDGAVTMMMRYSIASRSHILEDVEQS